MQLQTTSPEGKFPNEYIGVIFIQIDQQLKKVIEKIQRGPDLMEHGVDYFCLICIYFPCTFQTLSSIQLDDRRKRENCCDNLH